MAVAVGAASRGGVGVLQLVLLARPPDEGAAARLARLLGGRRGLRTALGLLLALRAQAGVEPDENQRHRISIR